MIPFQGLKNVIQRNIFYFFSTFIPCSVGFRYKLETESVLHLYCLQIVKCKCTAHLLFTNWKLKVYCTCTVYKYCVSVLHIYFYKLEIKSVLHLYCLQILCKCTTHVLFTSWKLENWKIVSVLNLYCLQIVNCKCTAPVLFSNFKV